jgi:hypothetical protein
LIFLLEVLDVLLGNLNIRFELEDVDEVLSFVSELLLEVVDLFRCAWVFKLVDNVEEHGVLVGLLHNFSNFVVEIS